MSPEIGRLVLVIGVVLVLIGGLAVLGIRLPFGRLPGDIAISGGRGGVYIPLGSMLVISLVLTYFTWGQVFSLFPATLGDYFGSRHATSNYAVLYTAKGVSAAVLENDGAVSTYSQQYPRTSGHHPVGGEFDDTTTVTHFAPGQWYYKWERGVDHLDICISPQPNQIGWQKRFYTALFARLAALDIL